ncbi:MAG: S9 family peptidase, partial [Candidatus Aminicenantes bacterium]|nr:S9 family peptidase [Candidatus Aminicenantes bacterium]
MKKLIFFVFIFVFVYLSVAGTDDPYLWLEDVQGEKSLEWAKARNAESIKVLESVPGFKNAYKSILEILDSDKKIPYAKKYGKYLYNFWKDADHPRGIYRRTTIEEYRKDSPAWEVVLDFDELAKVENENWVYKGMQLLYPDYNRGLVNLSRGGSDATVVREFNVNKKEFVKDGFNLPEAKSIIQWIDDDTVFVGTNFGPESLTESGYPAIVKIWKRDTPLSAAKTILKGSKKSVYTYGARLFSENGNFDIIVEANTFF